MVLPAYVKKHPSFFKYIPVLKNSGGNALYPFIFVRETIYDDLQKEMPHPQSLAILLHEEMHRKRQQELGWFLFGIKYIFSRNFRFQEELRAYKTTMKEYKKHNLVFDCQKAAKFLSGPLYLWSVSYQNALRELENAWNNA